MASEHDIVQNAHVAAEFEVLKGSHYPVIRNLERFEPGQQSTVQHYVPGVRRQGPGDHVEQGGFPRAVRTDYGFDTSLPDIEGHVVHGVQSSEPLVQTPDFQ